MSQIFRGVFGVLNAGPPPIQKAAGVGLQCATSDVATRNYRSITASASMRMRRREAELLGRVEPVRRRRHDLRAPPNSRLFQRR